MEKNKQAKSGISAFGIVVIVLVVLLIGAFVAGVFILRDQFKSVVEATDQAVTEFPEQFKQEFENGFGQQFGVDIEGEKEEPEEPHAPQATPVPTPVASEEDRIMPELDGQVPEGLSSGSDLIPAIFENVSDSVIGVIHYRRVQNVLTTYGTGTGFVVSSSGYILTNAHLVEDAEKVTVMFPNDEELDAKVIGMDVDTDVAVLKVEKEGLKALALGNSDNVRVGEFVLAIGNPLDMKRLANTLTFGIISAKSREVTIDGQTNYFLQTDASINFGNSGGPLLNMRGEVIGINSAKSVTAGYDNYGNPISAEGIGFALPINTAVDIMEELVKNGSVERPAVGITVTSYTKTQAELVGIEPGTYVQSVVKDGPGSKAGLRAGDRIVSADGMEIMDQSELVSLIESKRVGEEIVLVVSRDGKEIECRLQLGNKASMDFDDTDAADGQEKSK